MPDLVRVLKNRAYGLIKLYTVSGGVMSPVGVYPVRRPVVIIERNTGVQGHGVEDGDVAHYHSVPLSQWGIQRTTDRCGQTLDVNRLSG